MSRFLRHGLRRIFKKSTICNPQSAIIKTGLILLFGAAILVTGCGRNPIAPAEDTYFSESWEDDYDSEFDFSLEEEDEGMDTSSDFLLGYWGRKEISLNEQGWITIR